jgi:hypothetical protein
MVVEPVLVLSEAERFKLDASDDSLFYAEPRFCAASRCGLSRPAHGPLPRADSALCGGAGFDEQLGEPPAR